MSLPKQGEQVGEEGQRYAFSAEWYDRSAALVRQYTVVFYINDDTMEIYDVKNHRLFLKRTKVDGIHLSDFTIGSYVNILSRPFLIVDFADEFSRRSLSNRNERTFAMIKPDSFGSLGDILEIIYGAGLQVTKLRSAHFERKQAAEFYAEHVGKPFFQTLVEYLSSGSVIGMEVAGPNAVSKWRELLGATDPAVAKSDNPLSVRAKFGLDKTRNAAHGSDSPASAARELEQFFGGPAPSGANAGLAPGLRLASSAQFRDSALVLIKPHAVLAGQAGGIVNYLRSSGGFSVTAAAVYFLDKANAEEFLAVYKGVVAEYTKLVDELLTGPVLALEVTKEGLRGEQVVTALRELVGPHDPEIGRHLRPRSLRAMFGRDKVRNAVHCTDLPEDGPLETEFFFKLLDA